MNYLARYIFFYFNIRCVNATLWLKRQTNVCPLFLGDYGRAIRYFLAYAVDFDGDIYE
jgi:hypothetical protein